MSVEFREGVPADRDAILALRRVVFPHEDLEKQTPEFWEWEFRDARFFVAQSGPQIVGHIGFVRQQLDGDIRSALAVDAMVPPEFHRQKVFSRLMSFAAEELRGDVQAVTLFHIRKPVVGGLVTAGWRPMPPRVPILMRPVSLRRIAQDFGLSFGPRALRDVASRETADVRTLQPAHFHEVDALVATQAMRTPRTAAFLDRRYVQCPHWRYVMKGFFVDEQLRAFLVYRDTTLKGMRTMAIADAGGDPAALRKLLAHAMASGHERGVGLAAAFLSPAHPAYRTIRRSGFFPGPHRFHFMLNVFDPRVEHLYDAPWSLSWGDTDHL